MRQALIFTALGLVAGIGMAMVFGGGKLPGLAPASVSEGSVQHEQGALSDRIVALETALAAEVRQRAALQSDLASLAERFAALSGAAGPSASASTEPQTFGESDAAEGPSPDAVAQRFSNRRERASPEYRLNQLVEAGFAPDQAQWIIDREAQSRMAMLNAQYEARRQGQPFNPLEGQLESQTEMRQQLGDAMYAQYLEATGRPTSVAVREVLDSSPGQAAGLQSGDEIVAYAGQRVFNLIELNELTLGGQPGETVAVDILRNGQQMQIYVPRGPIGFASGGRNFAFGPGGFLP
jgi:hypothetical protein